MKKSKDTFYVQNKIFFRKSCRLRDSEEKYGTARLATCDNVNRAHARCVLDKKATNTHTHTHTHTHTQNK